jgi:Zn finger protein HypA/HybF involved in hydrogenase expression
MRMVRIVECRCNKCGGEFKIRIDDLKECPHCGKFADVSVIKIDENGE